MIRCKTCGLTTPEFHGWIFTTGSCSGVTDGYRSALHDWEAVVVAVKKPPPRRRRW